MIWFWLQCSNFLRPYWPKQCSETMRNITNFKVSEYFSLLAEYVQGCMPWFLPDYLQISQLHIHSSNNTIHNRSVSHWTAFKFIQPFLQIDWYGELFWAGWYKQTTMTNHIIGSNREQKRTQIWSKTSDNTVVQPTRGLYSIFENNRDPCNRPPTDLKYYYNFGKQSSLDSRERANCAISFPKKKI